MGDLKYRERLCTSVDKGLHKAIYSHSIQTRIALSRIIDEAIEDYLNKNHLAYEYCGCREGLYDEHTKPY